jgi:putative ABC transport system substrate-binding protein
MGAVGLGLLAGCGRLPWQAESPPRIYRIGYLAGAAEHEARLAALREGLSALGYVEGQNLVIEQRFGEGNNEALREPARELARLGTEVLVVPSAAVARVVQDTGSSIPVVVAGIGDPIASGVASSLAHPGGNVTGLASPVLVGKSLQLLQEAAPAISKVAVLMDAGTGPARIEPYADDAQKLGLAVQPFLVQGAQELDAVFAAVRAADADAMYVTAGPTISTARARIAELALQGGLPSVWVQQVYYPAGLMAYGPNSLAQYHGVATYVDKLLKGARATELPIQYPTVFDFVINLKTAQALGLTIPQHVLLQATEVIQ